jgi:hypothetical protein
MQITEHIYNSLGRPDISSDECLGPCCLCGGEGTLDRKAFIKEGFTNYDYLLALDSPAICQACAACLSERNLRARSWVALPAGLILIKRENIWGWLFGMQSQSIPFAMYVTTSHKKHGSFKARVNHSWGCFYVQFEEIGVEFCPDELREPAPIIQEMYAAAPGEDRKKQPQSNFTKNEIRTGEYKQYRIMSYGFEKWRDQETVLSRYRGTPVWGLLIFALNQERS